MESLEVGDLREVGGYRLRARLGTGGIGRAFLGFSPAGSAAVVKVVRPELAADTEFRFRLRQVVTTAQAVGSACVAPLFAAGPDDDPPWLATLFVAGPSLSDMVTGAGPLPPGAAWQLAAGLAEALSEIHSRGMVHRGLKPANVLLAIDGPRVADFWVSAALEAARVSAARLPQPSFLSPEQADGGHGGPASDVFSLGALLVFAATGAAPFGDGSARSVTSRLVHAEPVLDGLPGSLRDVAAACLAKDPAARPSPAQVLAGLSEKAPQAHESLASFWPSAVASLIRSHQARLDADLARPGAQHAAPPQPAIPGLPREQPRTAIHTRARRRPRPLLIAAVSAAVLAVVAAVTAVTVIWAGAQNAPLVATLASPGTSIGGVSSVAFSPDGKTLAAANDDGDVYLWDVATARLAATLANPASTGVNAVAFSPNGRTLAAAGANGSVCLWDLADDRITATLTNPASAFGFGSSVLSVAFSPDGKTLAVGPNERSSSSVGGTTYLWNVTDGHLMAGLTDPFNDSPGVLSVAFSPRGTLLAAGEGNGLTYLWNLATERRIATLSDPSGSYGTNSLAFSSDGRTLATADRGGSIYLWDVATARRITVLTYPAARDVDAVAFSQGGASLAAAGADGSTYLWQVNASPPAQSAVLTDPGSKSVNAVAFSPRGSLLATGDRDGSTYLWRVG